jgi:TPR repeat protein
MFSNSPFHGLTLPQFLSVMAQADAGSAIHQNQMGMICSIGPPSFRNPQTALKYFELAVSQRFSPAVSNLASFFMHDPNGPQDVNKGLELLFQAAGWGDHSIENQLGFFYQHGIHLAQDAHRAVEYFRRSADGGDPQGQYNLGTMFLTGQGVERDAEQGYQWMEKAAEQGLSQAMVSMGNMRLTGTGCDYDPIKALKLLTDAGELGNVDAFYALGNGFVEGAFLTMDMTKAREYYGRALTAGHLRAHVRMAQLYAAGLGGPQNIVLARQLLLIAESKGLAEAREELNMIDECLAQIDSADSANPKDPNKPTFH